MRYRQFGRTALQVSEVGFGAWAIGGRAYGAVESSVACDALARAEELGCNFVDTAMVYGESESILGRFLRGRRDRWIVCTKYSAQAGGIEATLEQQLLRLGAEAVDLYLIHWAPRAAEAALYEALYRLKRAGKARYVGVSLRSLADVSYVLTRTEIDGFEVPLSLLQPDPFVATRTLSQRHRPGVIARSSLREGFLSGKYGHDTTFVDPDDQRGAWSPAQVAATVDSVERFRFLEAVAGSLTRAAVRYPLSYPEVSTVIVGTKTAAQAAVNFGECPGGVLPASALDAIARIQRERRLYSRGARLLERVRSLRYRRRL